MSNNFIKIPPSFEKKDETVEEIRLVHNTGVRGYHFILRAADEENNIIATSEEGFIHFYFDNRWYCMVGDYDKIEIYRNIGKSIDNGKLIKDIIKINNIKIEK